MEINELPWKNKKLFGSGFSFEGNNGREINFETMDGWQSAMFRNCRAECICLPHSSLLQYSCSLPFSKLCVKPASKINYSALNCCNAQQIPVRVKCHWWRIQMGRWVQTATSPGWEYRTWNWCALRAGSISSQEWAHSLPGQMCQLKLGCSKSTIGVWNAVVSLTWYLQLFGAQSDADSALNAPNQHTTSHQRVMSSKSALCANGWVQNLLC